MVLALVLQRSVQIFPPPISPAPTTCPNCDRPATSTRSPYCSEQCKDEASFVRQFRNALKEGTVEDAERRAGLAQALWSLLGGGYPARIQLIPERVKQKVIQRDGKCAICGGVATTVDHVRTACNRPINLQAVCDHCARAKPFGDPDLLAQPDTRRLLDDLAARVQAPTALRACDDAQTWDWRAYVNERTAIAKAEALTAAPKRKS